MSFTPWFRLDIERDIFLLVLLLFSYLCVFSLREIRVILGLCRVVDFRMIFKGGSKISFAAISRPGSMSFMPRFRSDIWRVIFCSYTVIILVPVSFSYLRSVFSCMFKRWLPSEWLSKVEVKYLSRQLVLKEASSRFYSAVHQCTYTIVYSYRGCVTRILG